MLAPAPKTVLVDVLGGVEKNGAYRSEVVHHYGLVGPDRRHRSVNARPEPFEL
ncbi:hypothetical protein [Persicimonas caeni]|uniref:hypothetical protein n=1 Tax=Persicimonas caeni TaxID=2292766 RepID=UPI00143DD9F0|nr:hypothetical protein [Persicimonas caeni]